jgi:hypothetical protein
MRAGNSPECRTDLLYALQTTKEGFGSRASHYSTRELRPLPVRIGFPKDAEEKVSGVSERPLYIRIFRAKRTTLLGG